METYISVLHASGHGGREYLQRLSYDSPRLHRVRLEQRVEHLEDDTLVDGELGDDVREQQVAVVLGGWVHAVLGEQARPGEGHQPPQLVTLFSVVSDEGGNRLVLIIVETGFRKSFYDFATQV